MGAEWMWGRMAGSRTGDGTCLPLCQHQVPSPPPPLPPLLLSEHKVLVYNFADFKLVHQIETLANPKGLVAISSAAESTVLACLGLHTGQV